MQSNLSYGFCIDNNKYDSATFRIWTKVDKDLKQQGRIAEALTVTN